MKMFGYYALHTLKNQIRKLLRTWVLIFIIACGFIGGITGYIGGSMADEDREIVEEMPDTVPMERPDGAVELVIGGVTLAMFVMMAVMSGKNGAAIFLPADVNILFASPMKPQSVLMFRMATKLGTMVFVTLYLLLFMPLFFVNLGYGWADAFSLVAAWGFILLFSQLLQILLYMAGAAYSKARDVIRYSIYGILGILLLAFTAFWQHSGLSMMGAAERFFNSSISRYIPVWGWIKGFAMYVILKDYVMAAVMLALLLLTAGAAIWFIWHFKADFYEDAMAKSEQTAQLLVDMQEGGITKGMTPKRKKDREDKITRDGMKHGHGANVFFFKEMYNRFRFANFHIFTKTSETYLAAAIIVSVLMKKSNSEMALMVTALVIGVLVFFRSLGNSLDSDLKMPYFKLLPEKTWVKLFYSLAGSSVNCFLDMIPAMLAAVLILKENPFTALVLCILIMTVDFYSTLAGTFISQSVPVSAGQMVKQMAQVMFIYFGLLPDVGIIAVGFYKYNSISVPVSMLIAAGFNIAIGFLFIALIPLFIDPKSIPYKPELPLMTPSQIRSAGKCFSKVGIGIVLFYLLGSIAQVFVITGIGSVFPQLLEKEGSVLWLSFLPLYLIGFPAAFRWLHRIPAQVIEKHDMTVPQFLYCIPVAVFLMYTGNIIGLAVNFLISVLTGVPMINPLVDVTAQGSIVTQVLLMVVIGPFMEEFIFRKLLIERIRIHGEKTAVIVSAVIFGLIHGNFFQLFYAIALGLLFGYIYIRTGKLRYSCLLHMLINFQGIIVSQFLTTSANENILMGYSVFILGMVIAGCVMLCVKSREVYFIPAELELPTQGRFRTVWFNVGMILTVILTLGMCISQIFQTV